jgi:hypothetical protein
VITESERGQHRERREHRVRRGRAEKKGGAQRDTLLIVSGCAPRRQVHCGEKVSGRNQRRGSAPGQIEFGGAALASALTLAEPGALQLPELQKGSEERGKEFRLRLERLLWAEVEIRWLSSLDSFRMTAEELTAGGGG